MQKTIGNIFLSSDGKYCYVIGNSMFGGSPLLVLDLHRLKPVSLPCGDRLEIGIIPTDNQQASLLAYEEASNTGSGIMVYSTDDPPCISRFFWPGRSGTMAARNDFLSSNLAFHPDGWSLLTGMDTGITYLWDLHKDSEEPDMSFFDGGVAVEVSWLAFSGDGKQVLTLDSDKHIKVWDLQGNRLYTIGAADISRVVYSPENNLIATLNGDNSIVPYDLKSGEELYSLNLDNETPQKIQFVATGNKLAVETASGQIHLFKTGGWQQPAKVTDKLIQCYVPYAPEHNRLQPALTDPGACDGGLRKLLP